MPNRRTSKNSKANYLNSCAQQTKQSSTQSLHDQLLETRLRIERAKLAKLEDELPKPTPKYTRYEDMPPPTPEDEARFKAKFQKLIGAIDDEELEERLNRFRSSEQIALRQEFKERGIL